MNSNVLLGALAIAFGLYTLIARAKAPQQFWKLEPMKKLYGEKRGYWVHFISYTVVPLVFGILMLIKGLKN